MNYARGIQAARTRAGMSKRQLARAASVDPSFITRLESGEKQPSLDTLEAIAKATSVPMASIVLFSSESNDLAAGVTTEDAMIVAERFAALAQSAGGKPDGKRRARKA